MTLFICEKPSQAKDIARNLGATTQQEGYFEGNGVIVTFCVGHLLAQAPPEAYCDKVKPWRMEILPVIPKTWQMLPIKKTQKQFSTIKRLLKDTQHVVIATDADREGDVIGREILALCDFKGKVERLWLSALDDASIQKALADIRPGASTENLYQAGLGRSRADWLIGMNLTMAASSLFSVPGIPLSVGRVQTPTLKLVVDRDMAIENFVAKDYFQLQATFANENTPFNATWVMPEEICDDQGKCVDKAMVEVAQKATEGQTGVVTVFTQTVKKTKAPLCLSLSQLQKLASSQLGLGAKATLEIAQSLYENHKATTYPRTDCGYLPLSQWSDAPSILDNLAANLPLLQPVIKLCDVSLQSSVWNDKKVTAHHGIIPTTKTPIDMSAMSKNEKAVYTLISRYYLAQFLGDYEYEHRHVTIDVQGHSFSATDNTPVVQGWKVTMVEEKTDKASAPPNPLPLVEIGETLTVSKSDLLSKKTTPPPRFTEGTLIEAMKSVAKYVSEPELKKVLKATAGIGTEATRASIIETLFARGFIEKRKKQLISTTIGRELIALLPDVVKHPATTAQWEMLLDEIADGKGSLEDFLYDQEDSLEAMLEELVEAKAQGKTLASIKTAPCPKCDNQLVRRKSKQGDGYYWSCSGYPNCTVVMNDKQGKPIEKPPEVLSDILCPTCNQFKLVKRGKPQATFWGCKGYPKKCQAMFADKAGVPDTTTPFAFTKTKRKKGKPTSRKKGRN